MNHQVKILMLRLKNYVVDKRLASCKRYILSYNYINTHIPQGHGDCFTERIYVLTYFLIVELIQHSLIYNRRKFLINLAFIFKLYNACFTV